MSTQQDNAQEHNIQTAERGSGHAQDSNASTPESTPQDPLISARNGLACEGPQEVAAEPAEGPVSTSIGLTESGSESSADDAESCGHTSCVPGPQFSSIGLSETAPVDPHEVRARLTRRGPVHGLELDTGTGVVFIPQHALPDLRRRLLLAQERFTAMSGSVPGKRRRRPASAR